MNIEKKMVHGHEIAIIESDEVLISSAQSALDLIATVNYETGCHRMAIQKSAVIEEFFDLSTRLAGEILQKYINYHTKLAIIGDFSIYSSKSLRDFIYESNRGTNIFFVADEMQALAKLSQ